jgi:hypothetical protein
VIPEGVLAKAQAQINEVFALLAPYVVALIPAERHKLSKIGEKVDGSKRFDFVFPREEFGSRREKIGYQKEAFYFPIVGNGSLSICNSKGMQNK